LAASAAVFGDPIPLFQHVPTVQEHFATLSALEKITEMALLPCVALENQQSCQK